MKDIDIREIFCEILGGMFFLSLLAVLLHIFGLTDIRSVATVLASKDSLSAVTVGLVACYLVGLLVDAVGLALGEAFLDNCIYKTDITASAGIQFWQKAPEHVLKYRDLQWSYFSMYRNVWILLVPGLLAYPIVILETLGIGWTVAAVLLIVLIMWSLWRSARTLLALYYGIPTHF